MADITSTYITDKVHNVCGSVKMWSAKVKGDGSGVTIPVPFSRVISHAVGNITETAGYNPLISFASGVITYGTAPTNGAYHWLTLWGY
jgi:hypothetical protein